MLRPDTARHTGLDKRPTFASASTLCRFWKRTVLDYAFNAKVSGDLGSTNSAVASGIRQSAVVRVGVFPGTGHRPTRCAVTPIPGAVRPLPDSRAVMAGARPIRLLAGSGHRPGVATVDGELGQHREPAQRDEVGSRRVRQRGCGSGRRGRRRNGKGRRIRVDRKPLRHPRGAGAGKAVARWRICPDLRVVGVANPILSAHRPLFSMGAMAEQRSLESAAGAREHQPEQE